MRNAVGENYVEPHDNHYARLPQNIENRHSCEEALHSQRRDGGTPIEACTSPLYQRLGMIQIALQSRSVARSLAALFRVVGSIIPHPDTVDLLKAACVSAM